ncbi:MAG: trypsin-like peptidase domain-containing protein [Planctomycetes bacterium]|nr:trypsin-like peptidase domain-containing protein [Planctomycetota bacterium]
MLRVVLALALLGAQDGDSYARQQTQIRAAAERVAPYVVKVETYGGVKKAATRPATLPSTRPQPRSRPQLVRPNTLAVTAGTTSGVIVSADGWILVASFPFSTEPAAVVVTLADGRTFDAEVVGEDKTRGIALLKIEAEDLAVPLDPVDPAALRVGQPLIAVARTFGREAPSVNFGHVSALGRLSGRAVQVDVPLSPANYGGVVATLDGRVLGVAVALHPSGADAGAELYDSGVGFCVPLHGLEPVLERLRAGDTVQRHIYGIAVQNDDLGPGAVVASIQAGSQAEKVLQVGDRIVAVEGEPVRHGLHLRDLLRRDVRGRPLTLRIERAGAIVEARL